METQPIEEKVTTRSAGVRYGVMMGAVGIVSFLATTISGVNVTDGAGAWANRAFSTILTIVFIYLAQDYFKKNGDGYMSFGQGFSTGFWATLTSTALTTVSIYIYIKFIDSAFIDMIKEKQIEAMQAQGMSDEKIEQTMKIAGMFTSAEAIAVFAVLAGLFFGTLIALVVSIFTQKANPDAIPVN